MRTWNKFPHVVKMQENSIRNCVTVRGSQKEQLVLDELTQILSVTVTYSACTKILGDGCLNFKRKTEISFCKFILFNEA